MDLSNEDEKEDIDPELLKESGRASAIQDLANEARQIADRSKALEQVTIAETAKQNDALRTQNMLLIFLVAILVGMQGWQTYRSLFISGPRIESIEQTVNGPLSDANSKLDDIILFIDGIREVQENPPPPDPQLQEVFNTIFNIRTILCQAQNQPLITEACNSSGG